MGPDAGFAEPLGQAGQPVGADRGGRPSPLAIRNSALVSKISSNTAVAGQEHLEMLEDLAAEHRLLADQVAAMAGQELEPGVGRLGRGDGRPKPLTAARWMAARSVSSVLLPGSAGWRNCLEVKGWTRRASNPAAAKARWTGRW